MADDRSYFGEIAESYDRIQPVFAGPHYETGLRILVQLLPYDLQQPFRFIELGCGTATITDTILRAFPASSGVAVDAEAEMLSIARQKLAGWSARVSLHQSDIVTFEIPAYDVVLSSFTLHHLPPDQLRVLLGRVREALLPGGYFFVMDSMRMDHNWGANIARLNHTWTQRHFQQAVTAGRLTDQELHDRAEFKRKMKQEGLDEEYKHRVEDYYDAMAAVGFTEHAVLWRTFSITIMAASA